MNFSNLDGVSDELFDFIVDEKVDWWEHTVFAGWNNKSNKRKGDIGEKIISDYFTQKGFSVEPPVDPGHDRIIDGFRAEIKFSLAMSPIGDNSPMFNHIAEEKSWDVLILSYVDINTLDLEGCFVFKQDFIDFQECMRRQQGGKKSKNDDYIIAGMNNYLAFANSGYAGNLKIW